MLPLMEKRINLGINSLADETTRHGVLWVEVKQPGGQTTSTRVPIIFDKPKLAVDGLNYATWSRLKKQINKMGIAATHMELKGPKHHFCYKLDKYREIYADGFSGTNQYRLGFS